MQLESKVWLNILSLAIYSCVYWIKCRCRYLVQWKLLSLLLLTCKCPTHRISIATLDYTFIPEYAWTFGPFEKPKFHMKELVQRTKCSVQRISSCPMSRLIYKIEQRSIFMLSTEIISTFYPSKSSSIPNHWFCQPFNDLYSAVFPGNLKFISHYLKKHINYFQKKYSMLNLLLYFIKLNIFTPKMHRIKYNWRDFHPKCVSSTRMLPFEWILFLFKRNWIALDFGLNPHFNTLYKTF